MGDYAAMPARDIEYLDVDPLFGGIQVLDVVLGEILDPVLGLCARVPLHQGC